MSYEIGDYAKWVQALCERNYGVKEQLERILEEREMERKIRRNAFKALNRKN